MGRSPCCSKEGLNRGAWTAMEDKILTEYIKVHGEGKWRNLPKRAGLKRCGKSCRLRWLNYLRPDIKRGNITHDEEELIIRLHNLLGNRWSLIAGRLPGRTDNEIKNYWNTNIGKKIQSSHDPAATSNTTSSLARTKPSSSKQLPPPSPNKTTHFSSTAQQPYSKSSTTTATTSSPKSSVVWTKATKCTKVLLQLPQDIPQKKLPKIDNHDHHHNSSKPAVDYTVVPPVTADVDVDVDKVNDIYDEMVAGLGLHDDHEPLEVPFNVYADNHESNSSQVMALQDDHHLDFDHEKFLADFFNIDSLDLDLSDCFGVNIGENDHDHDRDNNMTMGSSSPSSNSTNNKGFDKAGLLVSQDMALFGVELQSGTANNNCDLIDPRDEMDWLQD